MGLEEMVCAMERAGRVVMVRHNTAAVRGGREKERESREECQTLKINLNFRLSELECTVPLCSHCHILFPTRKSER